MVRQYGVPHIVFSFALLLNIVFWFYARQIDSVWANVPPVPAQEKIAIMFGGDDQLAYRAHVMMLQNLGNIGGRAQPLVDYDYATLEKWFTALDRLDSQSNALPFLAGHYYGAVQSPEKLRHIIKYLRIVGANEEGEKWRWLGHAVFLARHQLQDNDLALELAYELAANKSPDLADWAKQMPAFVLQAQGQNELAYKIMLNLLISNVDTLHPNEVNYMKDYICNTLVPEIPTMTKPDFCSTIR